MNISEVFFTPPPWTLLLLLMLFAAFAGMTFGPQGERSIARMRAYRHVGYQIVFVFFSFLVSFLLSAVDKSFLALLSSTELPMAAAVLNAMNIFSVRQGVIAADGRYPLRKFNILTVISGLSLVSCLALVAWLYYQEDVSTWFSSTNLIVVIFVVMFSFAVQGSMRVLITLPDEF